MYLRWVYDPTVAAIPYGKFGAILCGLNMDETIPVQNDDQYLVSAYQIPADTTLVATMWEPGSGDMPPMVISQAGPSVPAATPSSALAVETSIMPTNPIDLLPGVNPVVGIWMLPSLLGATASGGASPNGMGLDLGMARFTINYDDGM